MNETTAVNLRLVLEEKKERKYYEEETKDIQIDFK